MEYKYFVSYNWSIDSKISGSGQCEVVRNEKVMTYSDIMSMIDAIKEGPAFKEYINKIINISIINYILLD